MRILVHAYQLSPYRGSEYSVAWNYIMEMGKEHSITVLYGANGSHMGDFDPVDEYQKLIGARDITFVPISCGHFADLLNQLNKKSIFDYSFYIAYNLWERRVIKKAKQLIQEKQYDLIHFLGPIGYREPGYLWTLPLPYLWGPIGGFENVPSVFLKQMSWKGKIKNIFRSIVNSAQIKYSRRVRRVMKISDNVLACSSSAANYIYNNYGIKADVIPENGVVCVDSLKLLAGRDYYLEPFKMIWIGSIDHRKSLKVFLDALIQLPREKTCWELYIVGDGPLKTKMQDYSRQHGVGDNIKWIGHIPHKDVLEYIRKAHCHVISSSREGNPTTIWEAMANGLPTITFDHCGMHDTVCEKCGIRVPVFGDYSQLVAALSESILKLCNNRELLKKLSYGTLSCAQKFSFDQRHDFFNRQYQITIRHFNQKKRVKA